MYRRGIILLLLAIVAAGSGQCALTEVPASHDAYISLGTGDEKVYNETRTLLCAINVTKADNNTTKSYPGVPVIQFNISSINITDDDVAILVLKAASVRQIERSNMVTLLNIGSDWNEESDITTFLLNILPARNLIEKNDLTQISSNTDGDDIFAFDVSQKLLEAKGRGDRISFLLEEISNSTTEIDFLSRESGQGPYLIVMPYPGLPLPGQIEPVDQTNQTGQIGEADQILPQGSVAAESAPVQTFGLRADGKENESRVADTAASDAGTQGNQDPAQMQLII